MAEQPIHSERIEWCDIYKGLLMVLVVIGHSTGMFNRYIYQFHMAAFFVISGYTSNLDKKSLFRMIIDKFYKIMVPFFFLGVCGDVIFYILSRLGLLDRVSTTVYTISLQQALLGLFSKNLTIYCDWLGALWFLPVLFFATILAKIIYFLAKGNSKWMFFISVLVFHISEKNVMAGNTIAVLAGIAQFYFILGILLRRIIGKYEEKEKSTKYTVLATVLLCLMWYVCSNNFIKIAVDWPSRSFNGTVSDILLPVFGITVTYMFSILFCNFKITKKLFSYIGKNTMGVMSFHFAGFKVAYALLTLLNCMERDDFKGLVPTAEVGNQYWFVIVVISLIVSLVLWNVLNKIRVMSYIFGRSKIVVGRFGKAIEDVIVFLGDIFKEMYMNIDKKLYRLIWICAILCCIPLVVKSVIGITDRLDDISITFPNNSSSVSFEDGWLLQSEGENYRWVEKASKFSVFLRKQTELHFEGYVPDSVKDMSKITIFINDKLSMEQHLKCGEGFVFDIPISEYVKAGAENEIRIEFDGVRIPEEFDEDQRTFSAMISSIEIR